MRFEFTPHAVRVHALGTTVHVIPRAAWSDPHARTREVARALTEYRALKADWSAS